MICVEVFDVFWKWFVPSLWCSNLCFLLLGVLRFLAGLILLLLLVGFLLLFAIDLLAVLGLLRLVVLFGLVGEFRDLRSLL